MTLYDAVKHYHVYLQSLRLTRKHMEKYQRVLQNILWFYGREKDLGAFDDALVLQYVKVNDPFDCDPVHEERGNVYCLFIHWLMQNKLIPAWADNMSSLDSWSDSGCEALDSWCAL